jgi:hypothetical protein
MDIHRHSGRAKASHNASFQEFLQTVEAIDWSAGFFKTAKSTINSTAFQQEILDWAF